MFHLDLLKFVFCSRPYGMFVFFMWVVMPVLVFLSGFVIFFGQRKHHPFPNMVNSNIPMLGFFSAVSIFAFFTLVWFCNYYSASHYLAGESSLNIMVIVLRVFVAIFAIFVYFIIDTFISDIRSNSETQISFFTFATFTSLTFLVFFYVALYGAVCQKETVKGFSIGERSYKTNVSSKIKFVSGITDENVYPVYLSVTEPARSVWDASFTAKVGYYTSASQKQDIKFIEKKFDNEEMKIINVTVDNQNALRK